MSHTLHWIPPAPSVECEEWCRREGLKNSLSAQMAHAILQPFVPGQRMVPTPELPSSREYPEVWEELLKWRHPHINLNLLQLAIIVGNSTAMTFLWKPCFLQEESYTDESSKLVNHPVHLLLTILPGPFDDWNRLHDFRDEFFYKEGTVDLTSARLQIPHSRTRLEETNMDSPPVQPASAGLCVNQAEVVEENLLEELMRRQGFSSSDIFHSTLETKRNFALMRGLSAEAISMVVSHLIVKLEGSEARASTIELLWNVVETLSSQGTTPTFYSKLDMNGTFGKEKLILACQLYWAVSGEDAERRFVEGEIRQLISSAVEKRVVILRAVRYLPRKLIIDTTCDLEMREQMLLKNFLQDRSLKDLCVQNILKAVRGDARKIWCLNDYPEGLRANFDVPFQELHVHLQSPSQA